ncbi:MULTISPECIES: FixH family protein [Paracoccus]|jgi:nitrogen fixation protein FixH|uniref:Cbb3-type cytochrome oxidase biogenesis protein CcoH n=3 Tax=Pseudomonadota TaxID=1224 RepID=A0A386UM52_9RHOB|nr:MULTISPECIES: FixH family protein [Paracoccus]AWX92582.1 nitrogen fixation protein FixH [Paracoccus mutanolyticus]AYF01793.1 cbb3-type cytochrome oxidase biogenesis protein CcoH [Paracoccus yeei]MBY0136506.1 FixH family protein [Paracoccus yeei]QEU09737.1 FixH family protein [Paracoccus yeei]
MTRPLTGKHVLAITLVAFGVIIGVNVLMAVKAVGTFPGLEVANSYVASQDFDRERAAQAALDWTVTPDYDGKELVLAIRDRQGNPAPIKDLQVTVGRPTYVADDQHPQMTYQGGLYVAPLTLKPGLWNIHLTATAWDGTQFRQRLDHYHGSRVK